MANTKASSVEQNVANSFSEGIGAATWGTNEFAALSHLQTATCLYNNVVVEIIPRLLKGQSDSEDFFLRGQGKEINWLGF